MASGIDGLRQALAGQVLPVYYLASTEAAVLREAAAEARKALLAKADADDEPTRVDGPAPDLGEVVAAAGAISFFGTRRLVEVAEISPTTMNEKDATELAELFPQVENAILLVTALYKDKKTAQNKKAKALFAAAGKAGFAAELEKPTCSDNIRYIEALAEEAGARFAPGAAVALLERAGEDRALLRGEVAKLAAGSGYGTIDQQAVRQHAVHNVEADVFELARAITGGRKVEAYRKLEELLALRHEPIAIAAALAGTYVDMLRVRMGAEQGRAPGAVHRDFGYTGSEWRLQKAKENAARYTTPRLQACVLALAQLDQQLKSSALPDKSILLQAAVGQLMLYRERR